MRVALIEWSTEPGNPDPIIQVAIDPEGLPSWLGGAPEGRMRSAHWLSPRFEIPTRFSVPGLIARIHRKSIPIVNIPVKIVNDDGSEDTPCTESATN